MHYAGWCMLLATGFLGCRGYSSGPLYHEHVETVRLEMFDNRSFRRNLEYVLSDALGKRIEAQTPYKLITDADMADTVLNGQIVRIYETVLSAERETGKALEKEITIQAQVTWKDIKTGDLLLDAALVEATSSYSEFLNQGTSYAGRIAANALAERIVEAMETQW